MKAVDDGEYDEVLEKVRIEVCLSHFNLKLSSSTRQRISNLNGWLVFLPHNYGSRGSFEYQFQAAMLVVVMMQPSMRSLDSSTVLMLTRWYLRTRTSCLLPMIGCHRGTRK